MGILENSQDALNAANARLNTTRATNAEIEAGRVRRAIQAQADAEHDAREARRNAREIANGSESELRALKQKLIERDSLLDQWMVSQNAFKILLKKFGRLPDGRAYKDLSHEEQDHYVTEASQEFLAKRALDRQRK